MSENFKTIATSLAFGKLDEVEFPTKRVDNRRLTVDEIKEYIKEEFGKVKDAKKVKAKELPKGWGDAEILNHINFIKALNLKEYFNVKEK